MKNSTKKRVLGSALRIFAQKGFRDATVAEICADAEANVASVNYHFGDKEHLYEAVWRHAYALSIGSHPLQAPGAEASPEEKLRHFISSAVTRMMDSGPAGYYARIQIREMVEPTAALEAIVANVVMPQRKFLLSVIEELVPPGTGQHLIRLCGYSIASQCLFLAVSEPVRATLVKMQELEEPSLELFTEHIYRFSLAGIRACAAS